MGSSGKKRTTMAKLTRESKLRERRLDKQARKDARRNAPAEEPLDALTVAPEEQTDAATVSPEEPADAAAVAHGESVKQAVVGQAVVAQD